MDKRIAHRTPEGRSADRGEQAQMWATLREVAELSFALAPDKALVAVADRARAIVDALDVLVAVAPHTARALIPPSHALPDGVIELSDHVYAVFDGPLAAEVATGTDGGGPFYASEGMHLVVPSLDHGCLFTAPRLDLDDDHPVWDALVVIGRIIEGLGRRVARAREDHLRETVLEQARTRLHQQNILLQELAVVDPLTGLRNRGYFERRLAYGLEEARSQGRPVSLVVFDVDHFKRINDTFGHPVGDEVLRELTRRVQAVSRGDDEPARLGGEEFGVVVPGADPAGGIACAERFRHAIAHKPFTIEGQTLLVTASFGVATLRCGAEGDGAQLFRSADRALYASKAHGRNRCTHEDALDVRDEVAP